MRWQSVAWWTMGDLLDRSAEILREEAAEAARNLVKAHEGDEMAPFHFHLGELVALGQMIYEANRREGRG